jgi:hypothetical protein
MLSSDVDIPADIAATLVDPRAYADQRLHDAYCWLRAHNPLGIAAGRTICFTTQIGRRR